MPTERLKKFLDDHGVRFVTIVHSRAYTAQEIAASAHIKGREMAKTVVVRIDGRLALAVMPASQKVDLETLREAVGASRVEIAGEREFKDAFPGCELGAMPPFGNLFDMEVFVAPRLARDTEIAFNAGSHTELIRLAWTDFERLVKPRVLELSARG